MMVLELDLLQHVITIIIWHHNTFKKIFTFYIPGFLLDLKYESLWKTQHIRNKRYFTLLNMFVSL